MGNGEGSIVEISGWGLRELSFPGKLAEEEPAKKIEEGWLRIAEHG